ncbi:MAG: YoaK family protein [Pseudomonadota bacterium]
MVRTCPFLLTVTLALLSGYIDTAVFVYMGGLFVAHVTGNFVLIGAALTADTAPMHGQATSLQLLSFPIFMASAFTTAVLCRWKRLVNEKHGLLWTFILLTLAAALASHFNLASDELVCLTLVAAMGLLNAFQKLDPNMGSPFTVMTGNVTAIAVNLGQAIFKDADDQSTPAPSVRKPLILALSFSIGCVGGAIGQSLSGLTSVALPSMVLGAALSLRMLRNSAA